MYKYIKTYVVCWHELIENNIMEWCVFKMSKFLYIAAAEWISCQSSLSNERQREMVVLFVYGDDGNAIIVDDTQ